MRKIITIFVVLTFWGLSTSVQKTLAPPVVSAQVLLKPINILPQRFPHLLLPGQQLVRI